MQCMQQKKYSAFVGERASLSKHDWKQISDDTIKANYQSVQFYIEEPEQNLYPMSQKDLVLNVVNTWYQQIATKKRGMKAW